MTADDRVALELLSLSITVHNQYNIKYTPKKPLLTLRFDGYRTVNCTFSELNSVRRSVILFKIFYYFHRYLFTSEINKEKLIAAVFNLPDPKVLLWC